MTSNRMVPWELLETWRARLFLVSVGAFALAGTLKVIKATTEIALNDYLLNVTGQGGFVVALVGLVALYPSMSDQRPIMAKVGVVCAALGAVSFTVALVALGGLLGLNAIAGMNLPVKVVGLLFIPGYLGGILGFILYGVVGVRTGVPSTAVGGLFLLLVILPLAQVIGFAVFGVSTSIQFFGLGPVDIWIPAVLSVVAHLLYSSPEATGLSETSNETVTR